MAKKGKKKKKKKKKFKRKGNFKSRLSARTVCRDRRGRFTKKRSCRIK